MNMQWKINITSIVWYKPNMLYLFRLALAKEVERPDCNGDDEQ